MKKLIFLTLFLCGLLTVPLGASTYRVNNKLTDNPSAKIYSTIQAAHDAAYNGDTLMIDGSSQVYTAFTSTKRLVIKGPGYNLDENPGISANKLSATISGECYFNAGSAGSLIMSVVFTYYLDINDNNITVRRCNLFSLSINSVENITISECYFPNVGFNIYLSGSIVTNLTIANNIIMVPVSFQTGSTGIFLNNIFTVANITIPTGFDMKNNILFATGGTISLPLMPDLDICNNISVSNDFGTANNNQANVAEGSLFMGALTGSTDGTWQLKTGSPAIGAGVGGIDCGAFGGPQPYILSGVPAGPVIYQLNVSNYSTTDNKLPVTIKVKSY